MQYVNNYEALSGPNNCSHIFPLTVILPTASTTVSDSCEASKFFGQVLQFSRLGLIRHSPGYLPNKLHLNAANNGTPDHDWWASLWTFQSWNPLGRALCRYFWTASIILLLAPGFGEVFGGLDLVDLLDWCIEIFRDFVAVAQFTTSFAKADPALWAFQHLGVCTFSSALTYFSCHIFLWCFDIFPVRYISPMLWHISRATFMPTTTRVLQLEK